MSKTQKDKVIKELRSIRNIGPAIAGKLYQVGVRSPEEVLGGDPEALYEKLQSELGPGVDRCVLYVLRGAKAGKPWPQCSDRNLGARAPRKARR
jgi:hypothetical protein